MIIGNFTYNQAKDIYTGEIKTLTLHRSKVVFRPIDEKTAKGPDYRVVVESPAGSIELGAAWKKTSEQGRNFLSISLDDPALTQSLSAALMPAEDGTSGILIWSRPTKRPAKAA